MAKPAEMHTLQPPYRKESALHILFVCTGNICRSPTAERLSLAHMADPGGLNFRASSAGIRAVVGRPIHDDAARVLRSLGGDPGGFAARQLNPRVAADADLVVTMTREHRDEVLGIAPRLLRRTFTLAEASRLTSSGEASTVEDLVAMRPHIVTHDLVDVFDPIKHSADVFVQVGEQIAELLLPLIDFCRRASVAESA